MATESLEQPFQGSEFEDRVSVATQRQLIWWRFKRHKIALVASIVVAMFYLVVVFADFLATSDPSDSEAFRGLMPIQPIKFFDGWKPDLRVCKIEGERDLITFKRVYVRDCDVTTNVGLFAHGYEYKLFGFIPTDRHLIGMSDRSLRAEDHIYLLGTDKQGRDMYSRLIFGTRISLTIGLFGVGLSIFLGIFLGAISGFYGGLIDNLIQRVVEIVRSIPAIPLYMGMAAAFPPDWSVLRIYFAITIVISLFAWTDLARVIRGKFLSMRDEDFVMAAMIAGASQRRIIFRHMLPSFYSHIIAAASLALPFMIITETTLSFLGLGLRPPAISWGVLLKDAQNVQTIALTPWLLIPAIPVIVVILALNFMGDGLRDAADPYSS
ncbi:MAG: ABC transporter permease [SAR202 cluster bacterium]|nr:ABC transporter permease [SAR202 cluster bacterium]